MADISHGPVSTLPGSRHRLPEGEMCDEHPKRKAVARVQGETDSFGCEYIDACQECLDEFRRYREQARTGVCDWCKRKAADLRDRRDIDEGMSGRVYRVCGECVRQEEAEWEEENMDAAYWHPDWEPDDDDEDEDLPPDEFEGDAVVAEYRAAYRKPPPVLCKTCREQWKPGHKCKKHRRAVVAHA